MSLVIKICGLNDLASMDAALVAGADMVGLVLFPPSPRNVSLDIARSLAARARGRATIVALTVDADDAFLTAAVEALAPDVLQLHGRETPARTADIRARFGLPVMRALPIAEPSDLEAIVAFDAAADRLLFDARPPLGADRPGGHGAPFDWSLLHDVATSQPWLLAGGLDEANIAEALAASGAPGIDVSSGVESAPGRKDPEKIARFVAAARAAAASRLGTNAAIG